MLVSLGSRLLYVFTSVISNIAILKSASQVQESLVAQEVTDFVIVEYNAEIGGRVKHVPFGFKPDGTQYTVELGANWVRCHFERIIPVAEAILVIHTVWLLQTVNR